MQEALSRGLTGSADKAAPATDPTGNGHDGQATHIAPEEPHQAAARASALARAKERGRARALGTPSRKEPVFEDWSAVSHTLDMAARRRELEMHPLQPTPRDYSLHLDHAGSETHVEICIEVLPLEGKGKPRG